MFISFIKRKDGTGGNIFESLMSQANSHRNHSYEDDSKWVFRHPNPWSTEIKMDEYAQYVYDLNFFSSDHANTHGVKGARKIVAQQVSEGNRSAIKVRFIGELEIEKGQDDPNEIGTSLPSSGGTEQTPEIQPDKNDEVIDDLEKINKPEPEQQDQRDKEILEELQRQDEQQEEPQKQKEDELEKEDEQSRERQKQREQQKQKDKQQEEQQQGEQDDLPENSRNEK